MHLWRLLLLFALPAAAWAQVPEQVVLTPLRLYRQVSASEVRIEGYGVGAQVIFPQAVPLGTTVELRGPNNRVRALRAAGPDEFEFAEEFANETTLAAAYPSGTYTIAVAGNSLGGSSTVVVLNSGTPPPPARVLNFDALQGSRSANLTIEWEPIAGATAGDRLAFTIDDITGREVFSTLPNFPPTSTRVTTGFVPAGVQLTGNLIYGKVTTATANSGRTQVFTGNLFLVQVPMMRLENLPQIVFAPTSAMLRTSFFPSVSVSANNASRYEWRHNGTLLSQTGSSLPLREVSAAGVYTVEAINSAGRDTSAPFYIAFAPSLTSETMLRANSGPGAADGPVSEATTRRPAALAADAGGSLYFIDGYAVRRLQAGTVTTLAGSVEQSGSNDGAGSAARFNEPQGIAVDPVGNVYVGDRRFDTTGNFRWSLRRISSTGNVATLATPPSFAAQIIASDPQGNLYASATGHEVISKIAPSGQVTTVTVRDGNRGLALSSLAVDRRGLLFVADGTTGAVYEVGAGGSATLFAGGGDRTNVSQVDGVGTSIPFLSIESMAFDAAGNLFASDFGGFWMITPDRRIIRLGDDRPSTPGALVADATGSLYFSQSGNGVVKRARVQPGSADANITLQRSPEPQIVAPGDSVALSVAAEGPGLVYQWLRDGVMIPRANSPTLVVRDVRTAANYSVMVANALGLRMSGVARVEPLATATPGRMVNLSLRSRAGSGAEALIMGFVVGSLSPAPREVLVRGVGPGLRRFGVNGTLTDPEIILVGANGAEHARNDNYGTIPAVVPAAASVGAFALEPGARDSALLLPLFAGAYTVQVRGVDGGEGVALIETYDAGPSTGAATARFVNVSARTVAGSGDATLTAGVVIGGSTAKTVLLRAIGPGLSALGVSDTLLNPRLEVYSGQTRIAGNDNWTGSVPEELFRAVGAFALARDSMDAALVMTLRPGAYTVAVSPAPALVSGPAPRLERGVVLIELYELP